LLLALLREFPTEFIVFGQAQLELRPVGPTASPVSNQGGDIQWLCRFRGGSRGRLFLRCRGESREQLRRKGIQYVLVSSYRFPPLFNRPFDEWLKQNDGEVVWTMPLTLRASQGPVDWLLVKLRASK